MDPDETTRATLTNLDLVAQWAGIEGDRQDNTTVRGSLFSLLGLHGAEPPRTLALISDSDFQAVIQTWTVPRPPPAAAIPPTMAQLGQAGVFHRTCRYLCGTLPSQLAPVTATPSPPAAGSSTRKVKMSHVINQVDEEEVDSMSAAQVANAYRAYKTQLGGLPPDDEELLAEQLTTLSALFGSGRAPYVDMAIWGPFQHRLQKKIKLKGLRFSSSGDFIPIELYGPTDFESWRECYMVFRTGAIMLEQITPARLDGYEKVVRQYHERYGRSCWPILYQADVRARLEQVERLRRLGQEAFEVARTAGLGHEFNPLQPWEWVWKELARDFIFWNKEVVEPCMLYLAKSANLAQLVDNDAPITAMPQREVVTTSVRSLPSTPSSAARPQKRQRGPDIREHKVGDDGLFTHNRKGMELCRGFQTGDCTEKDARGNCIKSSSRKHQCAKCLSELHGSSACHVDAPKPPRANHGKSKGKGRSKK